MSASWEVATATQITRSGATTTGTLAIQLADHIGGSARGYQELSAPLAIPAIEDDPLFVAGLRVINSIRAVLAGYGIAPGEMDHAIRAVRCIIHGFAVLQAANGFQWSNDPEDSFAWMIWFVDAGLRAMGGRQL